MTHVHSLGLPELGLSDVLLLTKLVARTTKLKV